MDFSDYENDIETIALVIEDLKSEDPKVKVQAVSKLYSVAQIIGKERIKEELLPYLIEIIEEKDNEDEFLLQLTDQLGQLSSVIDMTDVYTLLSLFEILVSMEEPSIRDKAIQKIKAVSQGQDNAYFSGHYLNMVKRLSLWDHYPSRVAACYLFAPCYPYIPENEKIEVRQLYSELAHDDTPMVRRAAAANLKNMVEVFEEENVKSDLIPLFTMLVKDDIDSVKINAIENSIYFLPFYSSQEIRDNLIVLLKNTDPEQRSWRVRYSVAEVISSFCANLDSDVIRKDIFPIYEAFLKDPEQEVKSCGLIKMSEFFNKLTTEQLEINLIPLLKFLMTDSSLHVRLSVTSVLPPLCQAFTPDEIVQHILPLIQSLLKDEVIEVKSSAIKVLKSINEKIGRERIEKDVFPLMEAIVQEKQWRCRLSLLEVAPEICKSVGYEAFKSKFADFVFSFINDHYYLVREQTILNIKHLVQIYGYNKVSDKIESMFNNLLENTNYLFRMTALTAISKLNDSIDNYNFQQLLENIVLKLSSDKVPNVKFVLIKTLEDLRPKISTSFVRAQIIPVLEKLKKDLDCDVAYFASTALDSFKK